ncbi:uncharacterized protein BJX67DRAFT_345522 [Aspergillus lucknowensis]|uniref:Uncharacterized protein n=1 Tax=Aspergillus lucknowensis TaxID=176173 RepID=A0ABR4M0T9_9EURO
MIDMHIYSSAFVFIVAFFGQHHISSAHYVLGWCFRLTTGVESASGSGYTLASVLYGIPHVHCYLYPHLSVIFFRFAFASSFSYWEAGLFSFCIMLAIDPCPGTGR